jgi:hypothetical protein
MSTTRGEEREGKGETIGRDRHLRHLAATPPPDLAVLTDRELRSRRESILRIVRDQSMGGDMAPTPEQRAELGTLEDELVRRDPSFAYPATRRRSRR